ncbi:MAG: FlgD immunoglobulin-like domain containing protein [Candidatus Krumholzibacteriia bacterium]
MRAGGVLVNYIGQWDEAGDSWMPLGSGTNGAVFALATYLGSLFVGGEFTSAGDKASLRIARWDRPPASSFAVTDAQTEVLEDAVKRIWRHTEDVDGTIGFTFRVVESGTPVRIAIYNARGQLVRTIVRRVFDAGEYSDRWNRRDAAGTRVARGVYFVSFDAGSIHMNRKLVLVRP